MAGDRVSIEHGLSTGAPAALRERPTLAAMQATLQRAVADGVLDREPHAAVFYDLDYVRRRVDELHAAFPSNTLHALAIKACPISELLRRTAKMGCGAEAATSVELRQALRLGIPRHRIVFDSPAKTVGEIDLALSQGVHINADSLQELDRIAPLVRDAASVRSSIGVRVNPGVRAGSIDATSTAMPGSKFGVSLHDEEGELLERFASYPWLTGLHLHVGSQGCDLELLTDGVARVLELAEKIEQRFGDKRLGVFDLGGGLPASYRADDPILRFADYAQALRQRAPALFSGRWRLVTEFGRAIWANAAVGLSRVEYTKVSHGHRIAVVHLGADMFPRTAYAPDKWHHEVSVLDFSGRLKIGAEVEQDVAGPLCFSGDLIARNRKLPAIEVGDHVLIHDVGAYTLSMWSRYNSRLSPPVYGFAEDGGELVLLRKGESTEEVLRFWD